MTVNYFENETFLEHHRVWKQEIAKALAEGREKPPVPRKIAEMLMMVAKGMGKRHNWRGYSYVDEMVLDAIENCIRYCANFKSEDPAFTNPFGYFSRVCEFSFYRRWHKEKDQVDLKNKMVSELGPEAFASVNPEEEGLIREWLDEVKLSDVNLNNKKPAKAKKKTPTTKKPVDNLFTRIEE